MPTRFHDVSHAAEFLQTIVPFNSLQSDALNSLAGKLQAAYYRQGKTIPCSQPMEDLVIIRKGAVRLMEDTGRFLDQRSEGEFFGHPIYFHGQLKDYVAVAEEDCLLWHLGSQAFLDLGADNPVLADYFASHLEARLGAATRLDSGVTTIMDLLKRKPVSVDADLSIQQAAQLMHTEEVSSVLVLRRGQLCGIVTDKDLRVRVLAEGLDPGQTIETVMTQDPVVVDLHSDVDAALLEMMRGSYHHLPVIDKGQPVGLVTAGDILRTQSEHPLRIVRDIHRQDSLEGLVSLSRRLPSLFERMVSLGRDVEHLGRLLTLIADTFTVRLIRLAEQRLGVPPMAYAWVVFGSQAREEQMIKTDQDNGLVLERDVEGEQATYFAELGKWVCDGLDQLGYVYCPGQIMALNPEWRVSVTRWKQHFDRWIDQPDEKSVMCSSIFFDIRCVHGDRGLVEDLQQHASEAARKNQIFLRFMAANALSHRPPLGFFRRFVQEDDGSQSEGLNLKHRGIVPITDLVRMRALESGILAANTFRRIQLAIDSGSMNESDAGSLRDALTLINRIRLEHQSMQVLAGEKPGNLVPIEDLSPLLRRNLKAAFMLVIKAQESLASRYQVQ